MRRRWTQLSLLSRYNMGTRLVAAGKRGLDGEERAGKMASVKASLLKFLRFDLLRRYDAPVDLILSFSFAIHVS